MSEGDGSLPRRVDARAEGQARQMAVGGDLNADTINFGDSIEAQRQILVSDINPNLPPRKLALWVDRAQVQAELLKRIDEQTKLIEVVALGGFGKSALAVWATEPQQAKGTLTVPVNFAKMPSFNSFSRWVLQELGFLMNETVPDDQLIEQLVYRLKKKRCLVVMDQLEAITEAKDRETFKAFLDYWQRDGQNSTVLVTTRQRFLPQVEHCLQLSGFTPDEGAAFLQKKAVSTTLSDGLPRLSEICNGHPLLLNLSAAWLKKTKENTLDENGLDFFKKLFQNDLDNPGAQVKEVFEQLISKLSDTLWRVLLEASVYRISITLEMAQAMQPEVTTAGLDILEAQGFLLEQGDRQWRLHPLVGEMVSNRRNDELEADAHGKAIEYFQLQLQQENPSIQDYLECFHHYCERHDYEAAYDIVNLCDDWLDLNGNYRILVTVYERLTAAWQADSAISQSNRKNYGIALNRLGSVYSSQGDYATAIEFHQQSLEIQREIGDRQGIANSLIGLGIANSSQGDYVKAIDFYQQSLKIQREIDDRNGIAASLGNLGIANSSQGNYATAIDFYQQSLKIQREIDDRNGIAVSLGSLGNAYSSQGDYATAVDFYQQSLKITREIGDLKGIANSLGNIGSVYSSQGDYAKAIDFHQQSLEIQREIGDRNGIAASLIGLGNAYYSQGDDATAINFYQQSLEITRKIGDRQGIADSLIGLGNAYYSQGDDATAIDFYQQSLKITREIGDLKGIANSLGNLGSVYSSQGDYAKAIDFHQQSLEITREIGDRKGMANSLGNLGNAYSSQGDYAKAIDFQQQSLAIQREIGDRKGMANSLCNLGIAYRSQGDYAKAIDFQQQSLEIQREIGDRNGMANSLGNLGNAYDSQGDYAKAIDFQQQSLAIKREIGDRNGTAISLFNLGSAYAKIDEHWKARDSYEQAKTIFTEIKLAHMVEKCNKAIQERNRIISLTPKKAPPLPTKSTEPDWLAKSMPTAPTRSTTHSPQSKHSLPKWLPYLAVFAAILLLVLLLQ